MSILPMVSIACMTLPALARSWSPSNLPSVLGMICQESQETATVNQRNGVIRCITRSSLVGPAGQAARQQLVEAGIAHLDARGRARLGHRVAGFLRFIAQRRGQRGLPIPL